VVFTEVPSPANVPKTPSVLENVLHSGHVVRVAAGADTDTLRRGAPDPADDMLTLPASERVFVARGATDLRRSFDRLSAQVQEVLRQDPLSGHVFVFFNRQRNRVKMLVWERDGFWLLYKRLEAGTFAALDRDEINRELYLLLEGIEVVRERRRYARLATSG
jgi:transposase